ncbi:MAG TPA: FlgD immunoglobulin-like domain containing protein [Spirochaetales bacterium]|nr:FlgD immunoglobulin-like domain containing protein [Spirochaetales bacterium]HRY54204.1 FlgD immunoglobulin-like domain containing protein [Spirochaetia bacterium]HRZ64822.1 FlgD immunoglobulin-like domain containing protein [Spirochaetia bacterium]
MHARRGLLAALALALAARPSPAQPGAPDAGREAEVLVEVERLAAPENRAALVVTVSVKAAKLSLNRQEMGKAPYESRELLPGSYLVEVSAPGYRSLSRSFELAERSETRLHVVLVPATGWASFALSPADAELLVDGAALELGPGGGRTELPVGRHAVAARRFGFERRELLLSVAEDQESSISLELSPAPFAVKALRPSRPSFNPAAAGELGKALIRFEASAPGSARLEIRDAAGLLVASADFPSLETWELSFAWDGRGPDGLPLPDGNYLIGLAASPAPGAEASDPLALSSSIRIDSSLRIGAAGSLAAMPGSLLFPDPSPSPAKSFSAELAWLLPSSGMADSAFALGAGLSLGGKAQLGLGLAAETEGEPKADLGLSLLLALAKAGPAALGAYARGTWSSADEPLLPGSASGIELSLPLSLAADSLSLGLSPGLRLELGSSSPEALPLARAGAWVARPRWRAGLSGELAFEASGGLRPSWPALLCAEARLLPGPGPLAASAYLLAGLEPGASPSLSFGLGLGFAP